MVHTRSHRVKTENIMKKSSPKSACINNGATLISASIAAIIKANDDITIWATVTTKNTIMSNSTDKTQMI